MNPCTLRIRIMCICFTQETMPKRCHWICYLIHHTLYTLGTQSTPTEKETHGNQKQISRKQPEMSAKTRSLVPGHYICKHKPTRHQGHISPTCDPTSSLPPSHSLYHTSLGDSYELLALLLQSEQALETLRHKITLTQFMQVKKLQAALHTVLDQVFQQFLALAPHTPLISQLPSKPSTTGNPTPCQSFLSVS